MKIDILWSSNQYGTAPYFLKGMQEALERAGATCRVLLFEPSYLRDHLLTLHYDPPDITFSFGTVSVGGEQRLCDMVKVPHFSYLLDLSVYYLPHLYSPYSLFSCIDRSDIAFLKRLHFDRPLFLPHATDSHSPEVDDRERPYDVVMIGTAVDPQELIKEWQQQYSQEVVHCLQTAGEELLASQDLATTEIVLHTFAKNGIPIEKEIPIAQAVHAAEDYARGIDRLESVRAITKGTVHVFGGAKTSRGWGELLQDKPNVVIHPAVDYKESLDIMRHSRVVLNSSPSLKFGLHERIVDGLAAGAAVITNAAPYIEEEFISGEEITLIAPKQWQELDAHVQKLLGNECCRRDIAASGRQKVMGRHTWDHRAAELLAYLPPLLSKLRSD